uniref:glycoside hydrolase family 3 protein n=1 Tax=Eubacterium cellulosolvens TaxID=29322 RepID=UPI00048A3653|nr:glycoside hydrolase family 3 protein [[Eubacterium] cellulosolvens]
MEEKQRFYDKCREVAAEGAVLLKNDDHLLPLDGEKVSVFGRIQIDYYRSGTGSGGAVHVARKVNLIDGLRAQENIEVNEKLAAVYEAWVKENPFDNGGGGWAAEPWFQKEMPLTEELVQSARAFGDKAIVVIGRTAGEDVDNINAPGGYLLTDEEKEMLRLVTAEFEHTVLLLNVANIIDMNFLKDPAYLGHIKAVLYVWQGGQEGGLAAADVIAGRVTPGGKLTDTIAIDLADYPSDANFADPEKSFYKEDIYVGYRYFETFAKDRVLYPFGFGMSYSTFSLSDMKCEIRKSEAGAVDDVIRVTVSVTNDGDYKGKETVQVYYRAPQGTLGQPVLQLAAFAKTGLLLPGESTEVELTFPVRRMASFDDSGATGFLNAWVLEAGTYRFFAGTSVRDVTEVLPDGQDGYPVADTICLEQLSEACAPEIAFDRLRPVQKEDGTFGKASEVVPVRTTDLYREIEEAMPAEIPMTGDKGYKLIDVKEGRVSMDDFIAQLGRAELVTIVRGEGMCSAKVTPGTASCFGGVSDSLLEKGIPVGCCSDGPSGIRQDNGEKATQMPIGTLLACTWNPQLVEELYEEEGKELFEKGIDTLLGPGMNIHRHPLNGRNFEYFSEDPYLTGVFACSCVAGIQKGGSDATIKHLACNNQELARRTGDFIVSGRALREIYLKAFEMSVKNGANSVMTAYNMLNGHHACSNYELTTKILREEWGYKGQVMSDWFTFINDVYEGGEENVTDTASMVRAQNDLYMCVNNDGAETNAWNDNLDEYLDSGRLTIAELQRCAGNILGFLLHSPCMDREIYQGSPIFSCEPDAALVKDDRTAVEDAAGVIRFTVDEEDGNVFEVSEEGMFHVIGAASFPALRTAQSAAVVTVNGEDAPMFTMSGEMSEQVFSHKFARFRLKKGLYKMCCRVTRIGLKFAYMEIKRI